MTLKEEALILSVAGIIIIFTPFYKTTVPPENFVSLWFELWI